MSELNETGREAMIAAIETRDLTRRFKGRLAVDAVSMTVPDRMTRSTAMDAPPRRSKGFCLLPAEQAGGRRQTQSGSA